MLFTNKRTKVLGVLLASTLVIQSQCVALAASGDASPAVPESQAQTLLASAAGSDGLNASIASAIVPTLLPANLTDLSDTQASTSSVNETSKSVTPSETAPEIALIGAPGLEVAPPQSASDLTTADAAKSDASMSDVSEAMDESADSAESTSTNDAAEEQPSHFAINADPDSMKLALANSSVTTNDTLRGGVTVEPTATLPQIDSLTRQILLKEIELQRFNLHFKMESAKQGRWKGIRYATFNEINAGCGLTGGIISVGERGAHLHSPKFNHVHTAMQENANVIPQIGAWIGAGAALLEFSINELHEMEARSHGFSARRARDHVNGLKADINRLLAEREALTKIEASAPTLAPHAEIDTAEGKILADIRDQGLLEYSRYHIASRKLLAFQQCQYFFDFTKNVTNALGYECGFLALHKHDRKWNLKAGVLFVVSGGLYMGGPIVSRLFAKSMGEYHRHFLKGTVAEAEAREVATLEQDEKTLENICKDGRCALDTVRAPIERAQIYGAQSKVFQDELASSSKERDKAKLVATQNVGAGLYVGASKVASGIMFVIPGFYHKYNTKTDISNKITNADLFVSAVISLPASTFAMADTLRIQVQGELNRRKQIKAGTHPSQLIAARLAQLDDMEKRLGVNNK